MPGVHAVRVSWLRLLALCLLSCGGDSSGESDGAEARGDVCPNDLPDRAACDDGVPSYRDEVAPIIAERCNVCHYPSNPQTSFRLSDYDAVYDGRQTVQSRIYSCVMPPGAAAPLSSAERALLLEWLVCGAPEE